MRKFILALVMISGAAYAGNDMARLDTFTRNLSALSASFEQIKILPESAKKFVARGRVKFQKDIGFIWMQESPEKQVFVSTKDKYCVNGKSQDLNALPYFYYVRSMIDNALNGNITDLESVFKIDYAEYGKTLWQLTAKPRIDAVADILQDIVMYGALTELTKVIITYNDGTIIILQFKSGGVEIKDEIAC